MDSNLKTKEIELNNMNNQKGKANQDLVKMEYDVQRSIEDILELKVSKYLGTFEISSMQTSYKKMEDCARTGRVHPASDQIKNKLADQMDTNRKLQDGIKTFVEDNPQFSKVFDPILQINVEAI
jgi:hypothetical protein